MNSLFILNDPHSNIDSNLNALNKIIIINKIDGNLNAHNKYYTERSLSSELTGRDEHFQY